jgi:hypothetical protein
MRGNYVTVIKDYPDPRDHWIYSGWYYFVYGFRDWENGKYDILLTHLVDARLLELEYFEAMESIRKLGKKLMESQDVAEVAAGIEFTHYQHSENYSTYIKNKISMVLREKKKSPLHNISFPAPEAVEYLRLFTEQEAMDWADKKEKKLLSYLNADK